MSAIGKPLVRLHLLGGFAVEIAGRTVLDESTPRHKPKELLKLIALQEGRRLHREQIFDQLWPGLRSDAAANNLRKNLHRLRSALDAACAGVELLSASGETLALDAQVWLDVEAFTAAAREALHSDDRGLFDAALTLYDGDLLPDDAYEDWTEPARQRLRDLYQRLLSDAAELSLRAGDVARAEGRLQELLRSDPLREDAHHRLIAVYARSDRPRMALRQYERCRAILQRELGVEPPIEMRTLIEEVRSDQRHDDGEPEVPTTRYATTRDGARIAFWVLGSGPPLLMMGWTPHTNFAAWWQIPNWRDTFLRLAERHTVLAYDARGTGSSDRNPPACDFSLEGVIADVDAVASAAGFDRFALYGTLHTGPPAVAYAARNPDRVTHLLLWCSYASGPDFFVLAAGVDKMRREYWDAYCHACAFFFRGWGGDHDAAWFAELWGACVSPTTCDLHADAASRNDGTPLLAQVRAPTLVIHRRDLEWIPVGLAEPLATIARARLVLCDGAMPIPFADADGDTVYDTMTDFLGAGSPI